DATDIGQGAAWRRSGERLERDVVFAAATGAGCGALEVGGVGGDVAARREAAPTAVAVAPAAGAVARAEELDRVGDDLDVLAFVALLVLPLAPVEPALDRDRPALRQVVGAVLALRPPDGDVEVVGLVDPFAALAVLAAAVDRHPELADRGSSRGA